MAGISSGWMDLFPGWLESPPGWQESLSGWLECLSGPLEYLFPGWLEAPFFHLLCIVFSRLLVLSLISDCLLESLKGSQGALGGFQGRVRALNKLLSAPHGP